MAAEAEFWSFPTNPDEFDQDDRISYSKLDNKYIAVQDDGAEYEFDDGLRRWIPMIDEALIEEQQRGYMIQGADAENGRQGKKRKMDYSNDREHMRESRDENGPATPARKIRGETDQRPDVTFLFARQQDNNYDSNNHNKDRPSKNARRQQGNRGPPQPKKNTAVYVTGLPPDATADEVAELFSRKCGVIAEEIDSGRPRIKLYTDADGNFKGDALIVFFKPQSVEMAIMLLDDTDFRFPLPGSSSPAKMRVQAADSSYKKTKYDGDDNATATSSTSHNGSNNKPPADDKRSAQDKAKIIKKTQKLSAKLADWSDDESPSTTTTNQPTTSASQPPHQSSHNKHDRVVILTHMFTLAELASDPTALLDIKEDVREECAKLGAVTNVVLYDEEEEGIVSVRFAAREAAEACLRLMHGRAFAGRIVEAFFATGKERFKRSKADEKAADAGKEESDDGED